MALPTGIRLRHSRSCPTWAGEPCACKPAYQAEVWSAREKKKIRRTFATLAAARGWRADALVGLRRGTLRSPTSTTLSQAAELWLVGAREGTVRTRSGDRHKPSTIRSYEAALRNRVLPELGPVKLSQISRVDVQDFADRLHAEGLDPSTVRNTIVPLRAIFRRALSRGEVALNPTTAIELAAVRGRRDRIASPEEAAALIAALPEHDRATWACAFYAGLRLGELRALRVEDLDLDAGTITVAASWDQHAGPVSPKSRAGYRTVPIPAVLRRHLIEHLLRLGWSRGLIFGRDPETPFNPSSLNRRAGRMWAVAALGAFLSGRRLPVAIQRIGLHEARHSYATVMIAAGVNVKALSVFMGHSSIVVTMDRYAHLLPGSQDEAVELVDAYLARAGR
jgi:integrase